MSVDEVIEALKALPPDVRKRPAVTYEGSWLLEVERPRIGYRDRGFLEVKSEHDGKCVIILG
jgi:hypothetical protein